MGAYLAGRCAKPSPMATPKPTICISLRVVDGHQVLDIGSLGEGDDDLADDSGGIKLPSIPDFRALSARDPGRLPQSSLQQMV